MNAVLNSDVLSSIREHATERFEKLGWPTPRLEAWKYTSLAPLQKRMELGEFRTRQSLDGETTSLLSFRGRALAELVFVDGVFDEQASDLPVIAGLRVTTIRNAEPSLLEAHLARYADFENNALTALNTAEGGDGAVIEVTGPVNGFVHLLFIGTDGHQSHPRNLVIAGRATELSVMETYTGSGSYFTNAVTEIVAGDGAVVDHMRLERESHQAWHVGTVRIQQERSSSVTSRSFAVGGMVVRNETHATLEGAGASLALDGLYLGTGSQHIDNSTVIEHVDPHCDSVELYKGILDQNARGIFDGRIVVHVGAQKTSAKQTNKNLLLSGTAIVDSKPTLVIHNDDVKCNHGSTIGQLDEQAMFYLRSRGIDSEEARALLVLAFASEIVDRVKIEPVREQLRRELFQTIPEHMPERRAEERQSGKEG